MGKYMRKSKPPGNVTVTELQVLQSSLGVRTRAKTQALQRMQQLGVDGSGGVSYLQLRSRKLEKRQKVRVRGRNCEGSLKNKLRVDENEVGKKVEVEELKIGDGIERIGCDGDGKIEAFVAENSPDFDARERSTRESTPCSFTRDQDSVGTPGSTTKASSSVQITKRMQNLAPRLMPTAKEMDEFFAGAEQQQLSHFIEKYNFDPVEEKPLPGRYEWVKTDL